jgi:hypothetical protein
MAANKGRDKLEKLFNEIISDISENGMSAISAMKGKMSSATFYDLIKDNERLNKYARATELRAEKLADEMLEIADNFEHDIITTEDGRKVIDNAVVNRDRLRVDSRKWLLAKLHPKKYGDKIDMTSNNESINPVSITFVRHGNPGK